MASAGGAGWTMRRIVGFASSARAANKRKAQAPAPDSETPLRLGEWMMEIRPGTLRPIAPDWSEAGKTALEEYEQSRNDADANGAPGKHGQAMRLQPPCGRRARVRRKRGGARSRQRAGTQAMDEVARA